MTKYNSALIALVVTVFCTLLPVNAIAAGGHGAVVDTVHMNISDKKSLQNGAKIFMNYCLSCHSAQYSRYNRVAKDLEIPLAVMEDNMMFTTERAGDLMKSTMTEADGKKWFGVAPPDLTLISRVRKPNWVYTYLRGFYQDDSTASGWNNSLFENVAMPHALYELQGVQKLVGKVDAAELHGDASHGEGDHTSTFQIVGDAKFELVQPGELSPAEFDAAMTDLTAFLTYLAEPAQLQRTKMGIFSLLFLIILMGLTYLLKKEYWRDVH